MGRLTGIFGSWQLVLFRLYIRFFAGPKLARLREPMTARRHFQRFAEKLRLPDNAHYSEGRVLGPERVVPVSWVSFGRANRHRIILHLHGGAYVMGSGFTHRLLAAELSRASSMRVALPDYALAPERPFPQAIEDALAVWQSLLAAGYHPRNLVISGDSAGGGLAMALLLRIQALGLPQPAAMLLFSPWVDLTLASESLHRNAGRDVLVPLHQARRVVDLYLSDQLPDQPLASPLFGTYAPPPPTMIFCSTTEGLLDDSLRLAEKLRDAGGDVTLERWRNTPHAWVFLGHYLPEAVQALSHAGAFLSRCLGTRS